MNPSKTIRTFIAIKIPKVYEIVHVLEQAKTAIHQAKIKWVDEANMHLTLKFLGDTPFEMIQPINDTLKPIIGKHPITQLQFNSIGCFGAQKNPKVIILGGNQNPILLALQADIEQALIPFGFQPEDRKFTMHITLGRIKEISNIQNLHDFIKTVSISSIPLISMENVIFYESILQPTGPQYKPIAVFQLQNKK